MHNSFLFVTFLVVSWVAAIESTGLVGALAIGGLAALKGAAIVGFAAGRHNRRHGHRRSHGNYHGNSYGHGHNSYGYGHNSYGNRRNTYGQSHYRWRRSVAESPAVESEDQLLSTVLSMDTNGCILKMLCLAQVKEDATRTFEENVLVDMFTEDTEILNAYTAAFVYASDVGAKSRDQETCKKYFPACPLGGQELSGLLSKAWGCGFDFGGDEEEQPMVMDEQPLVNDEPAQLFDMQPEIFEMQPEIIEMQPEVSEPQQKVVKQEQQPNIAPSPTASLVELMKP